jgi:phage RecT family recombinase
VIQRSNSRPAKLDSALKMLRGARADIEAQLPADETFERVIAAFTECAWDNHDVVACSGRSIVSALVKAASWQLEIGKTAFLVPRRNHPLEPAGGLRLVAIQGYKGKLELLKRFNIARSVTAHCVFEHDPHFKVFQGSNPGVEHQVEMQPSKRGKVIGAYAIARLSQTENQVAEISAEEIDGIRRKWSEEFGAGQLEDMLWYPRKTAIHRLVDLLPLKPTTRALLTDDDDEARQAVAA